jgi:peptide/nickel transport system permease protein
VSTLSGGEARIASRSPTSTRGFWPDVLHRLLRNRASVLGLLLIVAFMVAAICAPLLAPYDPTGGDLADRLQSPSAQHWFGTDLLGRDEYSRVLYGARVSLYVGFAAVVLALLMGGVLGGLAGAFGGIVDAVIMRVVDVLLSIPGILLAIGIVAWLDRGLPQITLAVATTYAPRFARLLRGSLVALRDADFVLAARSTGAGLPRLLFRHLLPNAITPLVVAATLALATAIIDLAGLGFLGLGPPDPSTAEWGTMLTDARQFLQRAPYLLFFPGTAIVLWAMGFNFLGDGLRESLDPRLRR